MTGLRPPLSTLRRRPHERLRMTRGQGGSLFLPCIELSSTTLCQSPGAPCCRHYPGAATGGTASLIHPVVSAFPETAVGSACAGLFEACSAFTRVTACTLALPPIRGTLTRRLQPFRYLHDCSGCFRLERLPGGTCTHWKAPPYHGARRKHQFDPTSATAGNPSEGRPFGART